MDWTNSKFKSDKHAEEELAKFLDKYMYERAADSGGIEGYSRIEEKELQKAGADVAIHINGKDIYIDEKATLQYINKNIPTFAFELCYGDNIGWFLKDNLITDLYCLVWPNAVVTNLSLIKSEDFTDLSVMMIDKKKLKKYVEKFISEKDLKNIVKVAHEGLLETDSKGKLYIEPSHSMYIMETRHLVEHPINLVIRKSELAKICNSELFVSKNGLFKRVV